ncbi:TiaS agmantine-binding domain-containing protein [Natronomonas sp. EA1]|uniref:TiaS agmantine-binding domain-containing protein n=1 Tax=Natronomonas sp. EA1 TaxID=3421655 RepID=UPI003EBD114F
MTVIGLDDTDSRERGMCTTYAASLLAARLGAERTLLVRLNPAIEYKTRGNAALAIHTDAAPEEALDAAREIVAECAETDDPRTNPGIVVSSGSPDDVPEAVAAHARAALREHLAVDETRALAEASGFICAAWGTEQGLVGALAAVGAWRAFDEWTYETIAYREAGEWGTDREVEYDSVFEAAEAAYPEVWDTVDTVTGTAVCVPRTPCPVLHGIRGDDPAATKQVSEAIESEAATHRQTFLTNQGTDAHLNDGEIGSLDDGKGYRVAGTVSTPPETREGGHVFFEIEDGETLRCAAFEPTGRFRNRVRALRVGDDILACGEVSDGTLKLEKFAVRDLNRTELRPPVCPDCDRTMKSAGRNQGYRCRECKTSAPEKEEIEVERHLEIGWYEVPPEARRHVAKPLIRGGFDAPTHPAR